MSPNDFFAPKEGQSLLIPGQREGLRGQCVQSVGLYVASLGISFPAYPQAYLYYERGIPGYYQVGVGNPIKEGDLIVWGVNFPASPGAGHIDVAAQDGTLANFVAWDSNWYPPLKLAKLSHLGNNNNYIAGYLRREEQDMPNDGDIINWKRFQTRNPNFQPEGKDFDFYKDPAHGWPRLAEDARGVLDPYIQKLESQQSPGFEALAGLTYNGQQVYIKK